MRFAGFRCCVDGIWARLVCYAVWLVFVYRLFWTACRSNFQGPVKIRLNSGDVCIHSVQNLLSSGFVSKNIKTSIHRSLMLPVMRLRNWSLLLREGYRQGVQNTALRKVFEPKCDEVTGIWKRLHNEKLSE